MLRPKALTAVVALVLAGCTGPATYVAEISDGVRIIHNLEPRWGDASHLSLEHVLTIGAEETEDERYLLQNPTDAILVSRDTVYVLDRWRPGIRVYDLNGTHLLDISSRGTGPAELGEAMAMDFGPGGDLWIVDPMGGKIGIFSSAGAFRRILRPERLFGSFRLLSDGRIVAARSDYTQDPPPLLHFFSPDGELLKTTGQGEGHEDELIRTLLNLASIDRDKSDNIYLVFRHQNRIDVYSPEGILRLRIDRPLGFPIETSIRYIERDYGEGPVNVPVPQLTLIARGAAVDDLGRIWALSYREQPVSTPENPGADYDPAILNFEVFNNEGVLLGYVPMPAAASAFRISGDYLLLSDPTEKGCVYVYRIVEESAE